MKRGVFASLLQMIGKRGHFVGLRVDHLPAANAIRDDHAADMQVADPVDERLVLGRRRIEVIAVAAHHDHLCNTIVKR